MFSGRSKWDSRAATAAAAFLIAAALPMAARVHAQTRTVGLLSTTGQASPGYNLFAPMRSRTTYLMDNDGRVIRTWASDYLPGFSAYLLENGDLLRPAVLNNPGPGGGGSFNAGGAAGRIERYSWDGVLEWAFEYSSNAHRTHHDVAPLPNGNVLMIAWEYRSEAEAIAAGKNPAMLGPGAMWPDTVIEVRPTGPTDGEVVWIWRVWDHLIQDFDATKPHYGVVGEHPELIDLNYAPRIAADWQHTNAIDYNAELDQIVLSVHAFGELWIIDHGTTTEEAAGHTGGPRGKGGDLLYRWGNPRTYRAGAVADQRLFGQHDTHWIRPGLEGAGDILIFNNGLGRPGGNHSTIDQLTAPVQADGSYARSSGSAFAPQNLTWQYAATPPNSFFAMNISSAQRLPSGNTLICQGPIGRVFEITPAGQRVWDYVCPDAAGQILDQGDAVPTGQGGMMNMLFRASRYSADYPGLADKDLAPGDTIERYPGLRGDLNCDGAVDAADAPALVQAMLDASGYAASYPLCSRHLADVLDDGTINGGDIAAFAAGFAGAP